MRDASTCLKADIAITMSHQFLTPIGRDVNHQMPRRADDLVASDSFSKERQTFSSWQEEMIEENISDEKAIEEMEERLKELHDATRHAFGDTMTKYVSLCSQLDWGYWEPA